MYAYIENGEVKRIGNLPPTWVSKSGNSISGFHLFANQTEADENGKTGEDLLREEGWLPLVDEKPEYDEETQYLTNPTYEIKENEVVRRYEVADVEVAEEVPQGLSAEEKILQLERELQLANARIKANDDRADFHEEIMTEMILSMHS